MGRQTEKSKLKQAKLKEERKKSQVSSAQVKKANEIYDPLVDFPMFTSYKYGDLDAILESKPIKDVDESDFEQLMKIMRTNMKCYYEKCDWGWNEAAKKAEMTESNARYLLVKDRKRPEHILGFSHFRFDLEYKHSVLYVYELQLEFSARRKKLGQFMLRALEAIAFKHSMEKVTLTVLKKNKNALAFFSTQDYILDEYSPVDTPEETFAYLIFSKINENYKSSI